MLTQATCKAAKGAEEVNVWVKEATRGQIPHLVDPGSPFDLVLANALYFKGVWSAPFEKR